MLIFPQIHRAQNFQGRVLHFASFLQDDEYSVLRKLDRSTQNLLQPRHGGHRHVRVFNRYICLQLRSPLQAFPFVNGSAVKVRT